LPYGFFSGDQEGASWVKFKTEKLPPSLCYGCGRIGHQQATCQSSHEWVEDRYGEHSRT
ncbi:hypothetical protein LINPERPRIM_LOCUS8494, partial [Linum perenne]